jgi:hypothetical protein
METQLHAFKSLGYAELEKRYGVKYINIWERPFEKVGRSLMNHFSLSVNDVTAFVAVSSFPFDFAQGGSTDSPQCFFNAIHGWRPDQARHDG